MAVVGAPDPWGRGWRRGRCWRLSRSLEPLPQDLHKPHCPAWPERETLGRATLGSLSGHLQSPRAFQGADLIQGHGNRLGPHSLLQAVTFLQGTSRTSSSAQRLQEGSDQGLGPSL